MNAVVLVAFQNLQVYQVPDRERVNRSYIEHVKKREVVERSLPDDVVKSRVDLMSAVPAPLEVVVVPPHVLQDHVRVAVAPGIRGKPGTCDTGILLSVCINAHLHISLMASYRWRASLALSVRLG